MHMSCISYMLEQNIIYCMHVSSGNMKFTHGSYKHMQMYYVYGWLYKTCVCRSEEVGYTQ